MHIQACIKTIHLTETPNILAENSKSKFKDTFTKATEVFLSQILHDDNKSDKDAFILATGIGNTENIVKLINEYRHNKFVSAQLFPESTMSSASVNVNRLLKLKGGNMTTNPNLALNDAILLGLLDSACNHRTTHLVYGEVNDFNLSQKIPNHLIYIKMSVSAIGSFIKMGHTQLSINPTEYDDLSIQLKSMMSPQLYHSIMTANTSGEVSNVYFKRQLAIA